MSIPLPSYNDVYLQQNSCLDKVMNSFDCKDVYRGLNVPLVPSSESVLYTIHYSVAGFERFSGCWEEMISRLDGRRWLGMV